MQAEAGIDRNLANGWFGPGADSAACQLLSNQKSTAASKASWKLFTTIGSTESFTIDFANDRCNQHRPYFAAKRRSMSQ